MNRLGDGCVALRRLQVSVSTLEGTIFFWRSPPRHGLHLVLVLQFEEQARKVDRGIELNAMGGRMNLGKSIDKKG
jgi:hypothetical protein